MTTNQTPLRYFGKCQVKGCKHRRVIEESSHPRLEICHDPRGDALFVRGTDDTRYVFRLCFTGVREQDQAMIDAGLSCPDHGKTVIYTSGEFSHNPDKVCNGKCMNAVGPSCDCSCGGENHGAKWV